MIEANKLPKMTCLKKKKPKKTGFPERVLRVTQHLKITLLLNTLSKNVKTLEKIFNHTNTCSPLSRTPFRRQRENFWIRKLDIVFLYGCNDNVDVVGNLSSPQCNNKNVMRLFKNSQVRKRNHRNRTYNELIIHDVSFEIR